MFGALLGCPDGVGHTFGATSYFGTFHNPVCQVRGEPREVEADAEAALERTAGGPECPQDMQGLAVRFQSKVAPQSIQCDGCRPNRRGFD